MKRYKLKNPNARKTVAAVWRHLRAHFAEDARLLFRIIKEITPLSDYANDGGTNGQWFLFPFQDFGEQATFYRMNGGEHGQGYGRMELLDDNQLTPDIVAHEMGHAFTSEDDLYKRNGPDEWASEAAADMHAVRWGLLTCESIRRRHAAAVAAEAGNCWMHHGPPPGGGWIEYDGARWRLHENFEFERIDKRNKTSAKV